MTGKNIQRSDIEEFLKAAGALNLEYEVSSPSLVDAMNYHLRSSSALVKAQE